MKGNHGKCQLLLSTQEDANIQIANTTINCSRSQKILGILFDNKLKFDKQELPKRYILMNAFFKAQFSYCPVVLMFHYRTLNNKTFSQR